MATMVEHVPATASAESDEAPLFSLILATVHRTTELGGVLESLAAQTCRDFELILVDQNPDARLVPYVQKAQVLGLQVRHVRAERKGLSLARNLGLKVARGGIVCFPDDDCWYEASTLEEARLAFERNPGLGGILGRWVERRLPQEIPPHRIDFAQSRRFRGVSPASICLFLRSDLVRKTGCFDERIGVGRYYGAGEETDVLLRVLSTGARVDYVPELRVHHPCPEGLPRLSWRQCVHNVQRERGTGAIYVKHRVPAAVVMRGMIGPIARAASTLRPGQMVLAACQVWGRVQGAALWWIKERA